MSTPIRILYLEDEANLEEVVKLYLEKEGIDAEIIRVATRHDFESKLKQKDFNVVLIDRMLDGFNGFEAITITRKYDSIIPVIVISGELDEAAIVEALKLGANDYVIKQNITRIGPVVSKNLNKPVIDNNTIIDPFLQCDSKQTLQDIANNVPGGLYQFKRNPDGSYSLPCISPQFQKLMGINDQDVKKDATLAFEQIHPDDLPAMMSSIEASTTSLNKWEHEFRVKKQDGNYFWIKGLSTPQMQDDGSIIWTGILLDIHDQKLSEEALRKSETNLSAILDNMVETFYRTDVNGCLVMISPSVHSLLGYKADELLGKQLADYYYDPAGRVNFLKTLEENNGIVENYEAPLKHQNGEPVWVSTCSRYYRDENGDIAGVEGTTRNINKRHYAEEALKKSNEELEKRVELRTHELQTYKTRYEDSQTFANIGTWDWNIQTGELYWSDRIAPLFGYPVGELETTYDNFLAAVHPDDREKVVNAVNACVESGAEYNIEHRCVWPDGTVRWLLEKGDVTRDENGNPVRMLGVVQDITTNKLTDVALKENQEKLNTLFELSPLGIALTDMNGKYVEFNDSFRKITGYSAEELEALDYWQLTPKEYETQEQAQLDSLYSTGKYGPFEKVYRQKNGNLVPIRLNGVLIEDAKKEKQIWSIVEDISDQKRSEEQLILAKNNAVKANKAKSEFLSHMSHELRTPLNAIIGFSQLLQYDENLKPDQLDSIKEIHHAGSHLLDLITEILDLSRIESGKIDIEQQAVNLNEVIKHCINLTENIAKSKNVTIENEIDTHYCEVNVLADPKRLKQSILNLLSNAIKYNSNDGYVSIKCHNPDNDHIQIDLKDTGVGLSEADLKNLFIPFNRLGAEKSNIDGTGIGLVITKQLIELMDGNLLVTSNKDIGSTFSVVLKIADTDSKNTDNQTDKSQQETSHGKNTNIVYIEDNPTNVKIIQQSLKKYPQLNLLIADEPEAGIKLVKDSRPELILLDINLPGMNGYEVIKILKSDKAISDTPVIAVSANAMQSDIEQAKQAGFNDYLTKPVDLKIFYSLLNKYLG